MVGRLAHLELVIDREEVIPKSVEGIVQKFLEYNPLEDTGRAAWLLSKLGLSRSPVECGWVMAFGNSMMAHTIVEVAKGSTCRLDIHMPSLLAAVLMSGADRFVFIHNHPAQTVRPSAADMEVTEMIADAAAACGLRFEDHIIVTPQEDVYLSMRREGLYIPDAA